MGIIETKPAKYKNVDFLMLTSAISGGRKDVIHNYPGSARQTVEDLGPKQKGYSLTAVIPAFEYYKKRDDLLRVLDEGGAGVLVHPFYGDVQQIVARNYVLNERISELGRAEIRISFEVDTDSAIKTAAPQKDTESVSEIENLNETLVADISEDIEDKVVVTPAAIGNYDDLKEQLNDAQALFDSATKTIAIATDKVDSWTAQVNEFSTDINRLISAPADLASSIEGLFSAANELYNAPSDQFEVFKRFFGFGDDDITINAATPGLEERAVNRDVIRQAIQVEALGYCYLNASQIEFDTITDIDSVNTILNDQYAKALESDGLTDLSDLTNLRTTTNKFLDAQRLSAKRIISVNTHMKPLSVIAYQYYGNTNNAALLVELNPDQQVSFAEGAIDVVTA